MIILRKLIELLTPSEVNKAVLLLCMIFFMALLDAVGVGSIVPFMTVLSDPETIVTNKILSESYRILGFTSPQKFLFYFGVLVFGLLVFTLAFKLLTGYMQLRFVHMIEFSISRRLFEIYLDQPYAWFLSKHSSDLGKNVLTEVESIIGYGMLAFLNLLAQGAVVIALLILLMYIDLNLALSVGTILGFSYGLIYRLMRSHLSHIGCERIEANQKRFLVMSEAFSGIKDVKLRGQEKIYVDRFSIPAKIYAESRSSQQAVMQLPRYILEALAFGGMLLVVLYLVAHKDGLSGALPTIALYTFAGYRLMPALQQVYGSFSQLRFAESALNFLHSDFTNLKLTSKDYGDEDVIKLESMIKLENVQYSYPESSHMAIKGVDLSISAGSAIALVGPSGSGKTTLVDLILGLIEAQNGVLTVDGRIIDFSNCRDWQKTIGYVPQQIHLVDDTILANIAFGLDLNNINRDNVERAARLANLHEFITTQLELGYLTMVGERGVRLSGGQRQRIAIARALYLNPQLLILDEATSALDGITEDAVMEALNNIKRRMTVIIVAHRISTVRQCDQIYLLEKGLITAHGSYDQLKKSSHVFQKMIGNFS